MSEYIRITRECSVRQLHPELLQAIQNYFQEHKLGSLQAETLQCCETISRKKNTGRTVSWLSGKSDTTIYTGMLLTSQWFIWAHYGDKSGTRLSAANLSEIRADFFVSPFTKDASLQVVGYLESANARVRGSIGMGSDSAAQKFGEEARQATIRANPPQKGLFKWFGS